MEQLDALSEFNGLSVAMRDGVEIGKDKVEIGGILTEQAKPL